MATVPLQPSQQDNLLHPHPHTHHPKALLDNLIGRTIEMSCLGNAIPRPANQPGALTPPPNPRTDGMTNRQYAAQVENKI